MSKIIIITAALTGSIPTKQMTPHVPITPEEIAESAFNCYKAGASIVHLHARDGEGKPSSKRAIFKEITDRIKDKCPDLLINISTGGRGRQQSLRGSALSLGPDIASLTTGSVNFPNQVYSNSPQLIEGLASKMLKYGIKPECEIFDSSMIPNALRLKDNGLIKGNPYFNFVMGLQGAIPADEKYLMRFLEDIPRASPWTVSGIGKHQLSTNMLGINLGGNVRTGLEDNLFYQKGVLATNESLVERIASIAENNGRKVGTPDDARKILMLGP
ncbi:MAG: 3-keto-5-aminohexanoate cleavage protein [Candidatus Woesearchaeota archaeon]